MKEMEDDESRFVLPWAGQRLLTVVHSLDGQSQAFLGPVLELARQDERAVDGVGGVEERCLLTEPVPVCVVQRLSRESKRSEKQLLNMVVAGGHLRVLNSPGT